ncbi:MAG: 2-C-methyl-D-erythritol 4-phosphate cytidylyltransferase [bacterium]
MKISEVNCTVIVPAAGKGKRFGNTLPKQFLELNKIPVIIRTLMIFEKMDEIKNVVIAIDTSYQKLLQDYIKQFNILKKITIIKGGKERQDSIFNALKTEAVKNADIILVHDAVRPFVSHNLCKKIIVAVQKHSAAIPGIVPKDTIKRINSKGFAVETPTRNMLRNIQTPQGFKKDIFLEIYRLMESNKMFVTDDASLAEQLGFKVKIVEGEEQNIKITSEIDLLLADSILKKTENIK